MRQCFLAFLLLIITPVQATAKDWLQLYDNKLIFDVYRNDLQVGQSSTVFVKEQNGWRVTSRMNLSIPIFLMLSFDYLYTSEELWKNGILQQLDIDENRNGKIKKIHVRTNDGGQQLQGTNPSGEVKIQLPILTSNHYNNDVIQSRRLLNTLTGEVNQYVLVAVGKEKVQTNKGSTEAYRYRYEGDLSETEVWYSDKGHWVKLWFKGDDGSDIELRCVLCMK